MRPDVRRRAQPVDARQRPQVQKDDMAAQLGAAERVGVERQVLEVTVAMLV
jgi:hypothetical protein